MNLVSAYQVVSGNERMFLDAKALLCPHACTRIRGFMSTYFIRSIGGQGVQEGIDLH